MITLDARTVMRTEEFLKRFPKEAPKYISDAVNRTATATKTAMVNRIAETHVVQPAAVKKTIHITRSPLAVVVSSLGTAIRLANFNIAQEIDSHQVMARVLRGGSMKPLGNKIFIGSLIRGRKKGKAGGFTYQKNKFAVFKRTGSSRLPIEQKYGPAVPSMLKADEVGIKLIEQRAQTVMKDRLNRGFDQLERKFK